MASRLLLLPALLLSACAGPLDGAADATEQSQLSILDGSPEAVGVLSVLNASTTTLSVLDDDVPLNKRAAENLIAWRDGADGVRYTGDDQWFGTMQQVDDVPWVGPAAISSLVAFAQATGEVPTGGDILGVWDNTAFTVDEANETLELVNLADYVVLDDDVPLSSRAVDNIVAARPFATILELASVPQVGPSSMLKLRNFAQSWAPVAGLGENCDSELACDDGLVCLGELSWGNGWCVEDSFAGTYEVTVGAAIPDGDANGLVSAVDVNDMASVPIDIAVWIDITHPAPESLTYTLVDPNGQTATLSAPGEGNLTEILWRNITSDDEVNGDWSLEIVDPVTGDSGTLNSWTLYLTSTWD